MYYIKWLSVLCVLEFAVICGLLANTPADYGDAGRAAANEQRIALFNKCMSMVPDTATDYARVIVSCRTASYYLMK